MMMMMIENLRSLIIINHYHEDSIKVKTEEKMIGGKSGNAQVNEAFEMNPSERGL